METTTQTTQPTTHSNNNNNKKVNLARTLFLSQNPLIFDSFDCSRSSSDPGTRQIDVECTDHDTRERERHWKNEGRNIGTLKKSQESQSHPCMPAFRGT